MSKLVTFEQAKRLKELGYDRETYRSYCGGDGELRTFCILSDYNVWFEYCSAPSTSEALEWFREAKGVPCSVMLFSFFDDSIRYTGRYRIDVYGGWVERETEYYYDTHSEAESALLDTLIEYVS